MRRTGRYGVATMVVGLLIGIAGCGDDDETAATVVSTPSATSTPADRPTLITQPEPQAGGMDAIVRGVLGINRQGCVVIDDKFVLIAPYGSTVVDDGKTLQLAGMGRYRVGDQVSGAGGYLENTQPGEVPSFLKGCFPAKGTANYVTIRGG